MQQSLFAMLGVVNYGTRTIADCGDDRVKRSKTFWNIYVFQMCCTLVSMGIYIFYLTKVCSQNGFIAFLQMFYLLSSLVDINWLFFGVEKFKITVSRNMVIRLCSVALILTMVKKPSDLWIYRQYQMYQEALGEWTHYDLDEDNHLVKKYSGAVIDKVTVNKMTKNILHEGMLLVRKAGAFVQKLGLQNETDFLTDSVGDNLGFQFMVLAAIYMDHGHWAVEFENGDSFYNLLEMCTVLRTVDEEDSADLLETFTLLKNEMEEQGMDILHIDHYNMLRNYIYTVAHIYKIFFDTIQKKLEAMVLEIDSLVDKNPDFIATEGKFKGCIFYQADTDSNSVDVFDPSGNIMADFSIFQSEAIRNYEKTRLGIQGAVEHN